MQNCNVGVYKFSLYIVDFIAFLLVYLAAKFQHFAFFLSMLLTEALRLSDMHLEG